MIPASGGLITAVNWSMSNMPRFETENVEPVYSPAAAERVHGLGKLLGLPADVGERLALRVPDHRRDEAVLHRHGHPNMHLVPVADVILLEPGVAGRMPGERVRGRLDDDVVERDLAPALITELLVEGFARLARPLHVYFGCEEEMGNGPERRGEPLRDGLADLGQRNVFVRSAARRGMRDAGCGMRLDDRWSGCGH